MNAQDESLPGDPFLGSEQDALFSTSDDDVWELGPRQTAADWLRLLLAALCLTGAGALVGRRFVDYVVHHVWDHSRNSPVALIVPVLAVEFLWIIAHVHTGGLIARLKIGLGAAGMCMALFAPGISGRPSFDLLQVAALLLTSWVFVDGWRDRNSNLRAYER